MSDRDADPMDETGLDPETQRRVVRERYAEIATGSTRDGERDDDDHGERDDKGDGEAGGCCSGDSCCGDAGSSLSAGELMGYAAADLEGAAGEANLGLGCGNPKALAALSPGETVLDLGSGAGFDCFLAAREVGETGRVIGVDMTPEMVERARETAAENGRSNVEFRLGEIEHLPVADGTVDVVISNCVVNLSPDKPQVFEEAFRVLRPGGRLAIADVVSTADVPFEVQADPESVAACIAGAARVEALESMLGKAGFEGVAVEPVEDSKQFIREWDPERDPSEFVVSAHVTGRKPDPTDG